MTTDKTLLMKTFLFLLLYMPLAIITIDGQQICENGECFVAKVDAVPFALRDYLPISAQLLNHPGPIDGKSAETKKIYITLTGTTYDAGGGKFFDQAILMEMYYDENSPDKPLLSNIYLQLKSTAYSLVASDSAMKVTSFNWEPSHKSFRIWIDFDCTMRSWAYPNDGKKDLQLEGRLSNILVNIPPWLMASNQ